MDLLTAALLGVVQGLTEFLPVSSSAHLIVARLLFGLDDARFGLAFDVAVHVGTLMAVVAFFRSDVIRLAAAVPAALGGGDHPAARRLRLIAAGTLPVVLVGGLWADWIAATMRTPQVAAAALVIGAFLLIAIERFGPQGRDEQALGVGGALAIGVAQASALVPGISRSGATIAMAMALGLRREAAARFTFLMSIPAVLAAAAREALALGAEPPADGTLTLFAVGILSSGLVGYLTVKYFIRFLADHRLDVFAWYRIALAVVIVARLAVG